jgi:hypothetical protein
MLVVCAGVKTIRPSSRGAKVKLYFQHDENCEEAFIAQIILMSFTFDSNFMFTSSRMSKQIDLN